MDGAVKRVDKVAQRILPDRPHHLSLSTTRRFPNPLGFWYDGFSSRLQYMTYLSDADRGVLLTRPSYEIRDDPEAEAVNNSSNASQKAEPKKPVTKMSFKDYQNKKKSSQSPIENDLAPKHDARPANASEPVGNREAPGRKENKARDAERNPNLKRDRPAPELNGERARNPHSKSGSKTTASPSPESRKRVAEAVDGPRPQKRPKGEDITAKPDSSNTSRLATPPHKELTGREGGSRVRDTKAAGAQSGPNGRAHPGAEKSSNASTSPKPTIHVNGARLDPPAGANTSPRRREGSSKPAVPPLLSPLRLSLDEENEIRSGPRKRLTEGNGDQARPGAVTALNTPPPPKKKKSPLRIPPLLSPTLPPIVESELARIKRTPSKGDSSQRSSQASESPRSTRKAKAPPDDHEDEDRLGAPSLIVTLKYKKKNAVRVQRLLALPSSQRDAIKKERSLSAEVTPPPVARKRPRVAEEPPQLSGKQTKPAAETVSARPVGPSTPRKNNATAMSRVTSSNSQANTPGDTTGLTPGLADRPPTSSDSNEHGSAARAATLRQRHEDYSRLGTKMKHSRDDFIRARTKADGNSAGPLSSADERKIAVLSLEMIMAYMISFKALNQARSLDRKAPNYSMWEDLLPHLAEVRHRTRPARVLNCVSLQLHAICLEELNQCYMAHEPGLVGPRMWKNSKRLRDIWAEAHDRGAAVNDDSMKANLGPWSSTDDAVAAALRIVGRWAEHEKVAWQPELALPVVNGA